MGFIQSVNCQDRLRRLIGKVFLIDPDKVDASSLRKLVEATTSADFYFIGGSLLKLSVSACATATISESLLLLALSTVVVAGVSSVCSSLHDTPPLRLAASHTIAIVFFKLIVFGLTPN